MTVNLCVPIAVCMSRDFGFSDSEIGKTFGCSGTTINNKFIDVGYEKPTKTQLAAQRFYATWNDCGYSEKFELIGEYKGRYKPIQYRCKLCGAISEKKADTISHAHSNIDCTTCWIRRDSETIAPLDYSLQKHLAEDYISGLSIAAIASKYNLQQRPVSALISAAGISIDRNRDCYKEAQQEKYEFKRKLNRTARENEKRIRSGFADIKADVNEWRKRLKAISDIQSSKQTAQRLVKVEHEIDSIQVYEPKIATCRHCGKQWLFWPSREHYGRRKPPLYCSKRCRNRANRINESSNIGHRLRKYGSQGKPRDVIKLDDLMMRDGGICYLCGKPVDKVDRWHDENGYHVCGGNYPSIDHVIPLCKGGTHTWDNVRLAHRDCNSQKESRLLNDITAG